MSADEMKRAAAYKAAEYVRDGMRLGLGTGSTAAHFVSAIGEKVAQGMTLLCVPTSQATHAQAASLNIPLTTLDEIDRLDLTVDGADEIGPQLALIKGGGGALLREKIVASASDEMIVIADDSKHVALLGAFALPIEVVPFGLGATRRAIAACLAQQGLSGTLTLRQKKTDAGAPSAIFMTDGGHYILDAALGTIHDPQALAAALTTIPGVVEHGLFLGLARKAILAGASGLHLLTV